MPGWATRCHRDHSTKSRGFAGGPRPSGPQEAGLSVGGAAGSPNQSGRPGYSFGPARRDQVGMPGAQSHAAPRSINQNPVPLASRPLSQQSAGIFQGSEDGNRGSSQERRAGEPRSSEWGPRSRKMRLLGLRGPAPAWAPADPRNGVGPGPFASASGVPARNAGLLAARGSRRSLASCCPRPGPGTGSGERDSCGPWAVGRGTSCLTSLSQVSSCRLGLRLAAALRRNRA